MGFEIERKFLLAHSGWRDQISSSEHLAQGYLGGTRSSVRIRVSGSGAWLNVKSASKGASRLEFEYSIPRVDADIMLRELADGPVVSKTRHKIHIGEHVFEIDEFDGENLGLIVAEIELQSESEEFVRPTWLGSEVTMDSRYYNANLARCPFTHWAVG